MLPHGHQLGRTGLGAGSPGSSDRPLPPGSCGMKLNLDYLLEMLWEYLALTCIYTKKRGRESGPRGPRGGRASPSPGPPGLRVAPRAPAQPQPRPSRSLHDGFSPVSEPAPPSTAACQRPRPEPLWQRMPSSGAAGLEGDVGMGQTPPAVAPRAVTEATSRL